MNHCQRLGGIVAVSACVSALGQGTVNCNNLFFPGGVGVRAYVNDCDGFPLVKLNGRVEVLNEQGDILSSVKDGTGNPFGSEGLFLLGVLTIPNTQPGGSATITIRVWDSSSGNNYATSRGRQSVVVKLVGLGGPDQPPPSLGAISDFTGITIAREGPMVPTDPCAQPWPHPAPTPTIGWPDDRNVTVTTYVSEGFIYGLYTSTDLVTWTFDGRLSFGFPGIIGAGSGYITWSIIDPGETRFFKVMP